MTALTRSILAAAWLAALASVTSVAVAAGVSIGALVLALLAERSRSRMWRRQALNLQHCWSCGQDGERGRICCGAPVERVPRGPLRAQRGSLTIAPPRETGGLSEVGGP